jgi:hypothetical protein
MTFPLSVCPELFEGPSFFLTATRKEQGFDKLSLNGI